jgi:chromosomal replication initiator protein
MASSTFSSNTGERYRPKPPWDGFLNGPENALAHAAILSLAKGEAEGISPLVVHGSSGVGKSRLLEGLVAEYIARRPESVVALLAAEEFAAQCAEAASNLGGWTDLRERFRELDLFALDDLHTLERAPLALAELAHTLDALDNAGAVVAISARIGPGQWIGLPKRLVNRLTGGLAVQVEPPGLEARRRYVLEQAITQKLTLSASTVDSLVEVADGYRTLDGLLGRIALEGRVHPRPADREGINEILAEYRIKPSMGVARVARDVAQQFGISVRELRSGSRRAGLVVPRHLAIHLARNITGLSYGALGAYFGARDAATVRHACSVSAKRLAADPALAVVAAILRKRWQTGANDDLPPSVTGISRPGSRDSNSS